MSIANLKQVVTELGAHELKIMCTGEMKVDWKSLLDLQTLEDGRSLKATDDDKISRLAESLLRFGIVNNLQVWIDENNRIYCFDAHHRKKAFKLLEKIGLDIPPLPATRCLAENITDAKRLLLVKESRSSWVNIEMIPDYMEEVRFSFSIAERVIDLPELEWGSICETKKPESEKEADEIPEAPAIVHIKTGDLAELDGHRLLCGDSTSAGNVKRLMASKKVDMVFTDPPYGVKHSGKGQEGKTKANNYGIMKGDDSVKSACDFFKLCCDLKIEKLIFWGANFYPSVLPNQKTWIVWDKETIGENYSDCELAFTNQTGRIKKFKHQWHGMIKASEQGQARIHPTQKPVALVEWCFQEYGAENIILDGFLGSGTTMIAAEKTGRRCFAMEIDPHYCQISIQRWVNFTGRDKIKINGKEVLWSEYTR